MVMADSDHFLQLKRERERERERGREGEREGGREREEGGESVISYNLSLGQL